MRELNPILHSTLRLSIMALTSLNESVTFLYLLDETKATKGNLSVQIKQLEEADYIEVEKKFVGRKPQTIIHITDKGRNAMHEYTEALKDYLPKI
jgi:DNA-binding MarR family transcriptional regulator